MQRAQVYEMLAGEGYRVAYVRVPLTDGACPLPRDFDTFYSAGALQPKLSSAAS